MTQLKNDFQQITQTILEHLKSGSGFYRPNCYAKIGFPKNFVSGEEYRGNNLLLLGTRKFVSPWYLTFLQAKSLGGNVRRGEKGTRIVKYGKHHPNLDGETSAKAQTRKKHFVKSYAVFNSSQIEGIEFPVVKPLAPDNRGRTLASAETILAGMPNCPSIQEGRKALPVYNRRNDEVDMPGREFFTDLRYFYLTIFHELIHSTGHSDRLARRSLLDSSKRKRDKISYAQEELVAELGAAFLSSRAGFVIDDHRDSAGYIAGWLQSIQADRDEKQVFDASIDAQKAVAFILGHSQ